MQPTQQSLDVHFAIGTGAEHGGIPGRQGSQARRQVLLASHGGLIHQDWNHRHASLQGHLDLQTHVIIGLVEPPLSLLISCLQPLLADYGQQDRTIVQRLPNGGGKRLASGDLVPIEEDGAGSEVRLQPLVQGLHGPRAICAAVGDEELVHDRSFLSNGSSAQLAQTSLPIVW